MNSSKQAALLFTVLIILYTLFDYFFLRGNGNETAPVAAPAQVKPNTQSEKQ